ncbi:MAG: DUF1801 domain-containing protein [Oricola sp.]
MDPKVESFFAEAKNWPEELAALRAILLACPLAEEFKWRGPVYTTDDGNVAIVWGFKDFCALGFFKGVLLKDPEGILVPPGDNSRSVRMAKFTSVADIAAMEAILKDYIREAIEVEKAGLKVAFPKDDLDYPMELVDRLDGDPDFREAFGALTPGRQRGWVLHFSQPKQSATRVSRIDKAAPRILAGKGMHDR